MTSVGKLARGRRPRGDDDLHLGPTRQRHKEKQLGADAASWHNQVHWPRSESDSGLSSSWV